MQLSDVFNDSDDALLIFRGDCSKRGAMGTALFEKGKRFDMIDDVDGFTFVAEKVTVKTVAQITAAEFNKHVFGHSVAPILASDEGPMADDDECTLVEFKKDTAVPLPPCWQDQRPDRLI